MQWDVNRSALSIGIRPQVNAADGNLARKKSASIVSRAKPASAFRLIRRMALAHGYRPML